MTAILRIAVIVVTLVLFFGSSFQALLGNRDISIMLALATPLGISAWGFARTGHNEAAMVLLCLVLVTVATLVMVLSPLGVHDVAITAFGGIVLLGALLLSRHAFVGVVVVTLLAATTAFVMQANGLTRSMVAVHSGWSQYAGFVVITLVFALLGRVAAEQAFGSLDNASRAAEADLLTGLNNRAGFLARAAACLKEAAASNDTGVLVLLDLDGFGRVNLVSGHEAADHLLQEVARRLQAACGAHLLGRVGDDEFAVLAMGIDAADAPAFARRAHAALDFDFLGLAVRNAAGYARFPLDAHGIASLHLGAQSSLAAAKARVSDRLTGPGDA